VEDFLEAFHAVRWKCDRFVDGVNLPTEHDLVSSPCAVSLDELFE